MKLGSRVVVWSISGGHVAVAAINTGGKKPAVIEAHLDTYEEGDDVWFESAVEAASRLVGRLKTKPTIHVLMADSRNSVARLLAVPFKGRRRVGSAVAFELEPHLAVPVDELTIDHIFVREVDEESEVLALGQRTQELAQQVAVLNAAGVLLDSIGLDVAGLTSLLNQHRTKPVGLHAALHVDDEDAIFAVTQSRTLAFFRVLSCGREALENDPAGAAREVQNTLRAFLAGWRGETEVGGLTVTGVRLTDDARQAFADGISAPVHYADLAEHVKDASRLGNEPTRPAVAMAGVAAAACGDGPAINFAKGELAGSDPVRRFAGQAIVTGILAAALLAGYIFYAATTYRQRTAEIEEIGGQIWALYEEAFPTAPAVQSGQSPADVGGLVTFTQMTESMEAEMSGFGPRGDFPIEVLARPTLLTLLKDISDAMPGEEVTITSIIIRPRRDLSQDVTIIGEASAQAIGAVKLLLDRLKESDHLQIDIEEPVRTIRDANMTFTITARTRVGSENQADA